MDLGSDYGAKEHGSSKGVPPRITETDFQDGSSIGKVKKRHNSEFSYAGDGQVRNLAAPRFLQLLQQFPES